jgi:hypothetical protein
MALALATGKDGEEGYRIVLNAHSKCRRHCTHRSRKNTFREEQENRRKGKGKGAIVPTRGVTVMNKGVAVLNNGVAVPRKGFTVL